MDERDSSHLTLEGVEHATFEWSHDHPHLLDVALFDDVDGLLHGMELPIFPDSSFAESCASQDEDHVMEIPVDNVRAAPCVCHMMASIFKADLCL